MHTRNFFGAFLATGLSFLAFSASAGQLWFQRINGPGNGSDNSYSLATDSSNNVFVAGRVATLTNSPNSAYDYALIKFSSTGTPAWTNYYNGPGNGNDEAKAVVVDLAGNVYVTGKSVGTNSITDFATLKYSNAGVPLWTNRFRFTTGEATSIGLDSSNNVFVAGYASGWQTLKYSSTGVPIWTNRYASGQYASQLAVDSGGNVVVVGNETVSGQGDDITVIKYSAAGVPLWTNRFNGAVSGNDEGNSVAIDSNDDVIITGSSITATAGAEFLTLKYSSAGVPVWTNHYKGTGNYTYDGPYKVVVDGNKDVIVTGRSRGGTGYSDFVTVKYSSAGSAVWTNRYNTTYGSTPHTMTVDRAGNIFVTGDITDTTYLNFNCLTIAYTSTGVQKWVNTYVGPDNGDDAGNAIRVDGSGNVYVCGWSVGTTSYADIMLVKYTGLQPLPLQTQKTTNNLVLTWDNNVFQLQSATSITATFTNVVGATSPYTNTISTNSRFFRLKGP